MERYSRVEKPKIGSPIKDNEIRITSLGLIRNYITYAITLLQEKGVNEIVLKAMGQAISKTVALSEILKSKVPGLHQDVNISSMSITDVFEPMEEGLLPVEVIRHVSMISITLSFSALNQDSPGYQAPAHIDQSKPQYQPNQARLPYNAYREDSYGRGRGRGIMGRGGYGNYKGSSYQGKYHGNYQEDYQEYDGGYSNWGKDRGGRGRNYGYHGAGYQGGRGGYGGGRDGGYAGGRGSYGGGRDGAYGVGSGGYGGGRDGGYGGGRDQAYGGGRDQGYGGGRNQDYGGRDQGYGGGRNQGYGGGRGRNQDYGGRDQAYGGGRDQGYGGGKDQGYGGGREDGFVGRRGGFRGGNRSDSYDGYGGYGRYNDRGDGYERGRGGYGEGRGYVRGRGRMGTGGRSRGRASNLNQP